MTRALLHAAIDAIAISSFIAALLTVAAFAMGA